MVIASAHRLEQVDEYYFSRKLQEIARLQAAGTAICNLGIGSPDLAPSPATIAKLTAAAARPDSHGYQSYRGSPILRCAISRWYRDCYGSTLDPDGEVLPLIGSKEGIFHLSMAYLNPGDEVLVPNPGYPTYAAVARLVGAIPRTYDLTQAAGWQVDVAALAAQDLRRVKLMWVNYPHMPTGVRAEVGRFDQLCQLARERGFLLVNDNPYSLVLNDEPVSILTQTANRDVALELNSLSKSHNMAGWRIGWLAGRADYLDPVLKVKSNLDSGMFLPLQEAAAAALSNPPAWHIARNREYAHRAELALRIFDLLGCSYDPDQVGLFKWGRVPDAINDVEAFVDRMLYGARVFMTPGNVFGSNGRRWLRISLCRDCAGLTQAHAQLAAWLARTRPSGLRAPGAGGRWSRTSIAAMPHSRSGIKSIAGSSASASITAGATPPPI